MYEVRVDFPKATAERIASQLRLASNVKLYQRSIGQELAGTIRPLVELTPKRTGLLRKGWPAGFKRRGLLTFVLENPVPYGPHVEFGTKPHVILPKRAKVLAWESPRGKKVIRRVSKLTGKPLKRPKTEFLVFARRVKHPGTTGVKMLERSLPSIHDAGDRGVSKALKEAIP